VDASGRIVLANHRTEQLFGYTEGELLGTAVEQLIPDRFRGRHEAHRAGYLTDPRARPTGLGLELFARRRDGTEFPVDIALSPIETPEGTLVLAAVRDVTEQRRAHEVAGELREAGLRRRQALEINDSLVQRLTVAVYALERGDGFKAARALNQTLEAARRMMTNLFGEGAPLAPGDLVRVAPATMPAGGDEKPAASSGAHVAAGQPVGVVVADDTPDIRFLLRTALESDEGFAVLGEAADGAEAVRLVAELRPDAVVLDLAMPVMDGLEALAEIRRGSPATKVVVFSGYSRDQAAAQALELGAAAYLEKGGEIRALITLLSDLFPGRLGPALTAREWAVLRLVADGAPAENIARRLGISHRTVHKHLEHLYRKLGVHDRAAAVHVAMQLERL
jgi:PAS domain S-box-containing protein